MEERELLGSNYEKNRQIIHSTFHVRIIKKGNMIFVVTRDFNPDRINISIDDKGIITEVYKG